MGCNISKLDRLPAVALCRDRCKFIDEALRQSYALADAHVAHIESLRTLGPALHSFFQHFEDSAQTKSSPPLTKSPSSSSSSSHSESEQNESQFFTHCHRRYDCLQNDDTVLSPVADNVHFMNYMQPVYTSYSPPPLNTGGFLGSKPPSPPPPSSSAWDFLNFFEPYSHCASGYTDTESTVEKEKENINGDDAVKSEEGVGEHGSKGTETKEIKEADLKEKSSAPPEECGNAGKVKSAKGFSEAVKEIQILFERASDSGNPLLEMLDVGKLRYHQKFEFNPVCCKMMNPLGLGVDCMESGRSTGSGGNEGNYYKDKGRLRLSYTMNLCSTLSKLCLWEKKLYHEVKAEEKLRMLHQKKCRQLTRLSKKDADAHKIDSVQAFIGILATKMKISIQVVDKISNTISKLMEEELWPQINRLILMFLGMWKDMQECYRCQYKEIAETKSLDDSVFNRKLSNANIDAAIKLKSEIHKWNLSFSDWIHAQKSHVKALNDWLVRCLMFETEVIPDGAPTVIVICDKWSQAVDNLSEKNVIGAVNGFMLGMNKLLEKNVLELQQKLTLDKELERKMKMLEKEEQKMHKVVMDRDRKMAPIAREENVVHHHIHEGTISISLQSGLKHIFVAMESFTATTANLYEELFQQIKQNDPVFGESNKKD